ncbi:MAG: lysine 2,3-aminomutase, partial [Actinomycetes bacterium]
MTATADVRHDADGTAESALEQPYPYRRRELVEPDWTRLPGWRDVSAEEWSSAQWQRAHCVKNIKQ